MKSTAGKPLAVHTKLMDSDPRLSIQPVTVESDNGFLDTTSTLTIPSVNRNDAGNYTCVASNTVFGSSMSDVEQFMLTVNCKYLAYMSISDMEYHLWFYTGC